MYFITTGRKGLTIHTQGGSCVISCRHPNLDNVELVFPELGDITYNLSFKVISSLLRKKKEVRLARHTQENLLHLNRFISTERDTEKFLKVYKEDVMDWAYPVHIVSTKKVHDKKGDKFQTLRTDCNNFLKSCPDYKLEHLENITEPLKMMRYVLKTWEAQMIWRDKDNINFEDYYNFLFKLAIDNPAHIDGFLIFDNDYPIAISLWDKGKNSNIVGLSNICNTQYKGLSSFVMSKTCSILHSEGHKYLNMGGSETKDLDAFKKQRLRPIKSLEIYSAIVDFDIDMNIGLEHIDVPQYPSLSSSSTSY